MLNFFTIAFFFSAITSATPLLFAAMGGLFSERSGVINIALEGLMLSGAFTAAVVTFQTGNPFLGLLCGMGAGFITALIFAVAVIHFEADQVVAGMAINFLMLGLPALISGVIYDSTGSTPQIDQAYKLPTFFNGLSIVSIFALILVPLAWYLLYKTPFGLRLRAVGENPEAADSAGISVVKMRYAAVLISGVLAAIGGAFLSTGQSSYLHEACPPGGFIALQR